MDDLKRILDSGGAVILPTETVYGIFAKALDEEAVNRVYTLKKRPREKALNLNVGNFENILKFSKNQPKYLEKVYNRFMPGPLTIILEANDNVPYWINSGLKTVGFRVPNHPVTLELIKQCGPLIGPSANISGQVSGRNYLAILEAFDQKVTGFSDDVALTGRDSTILDLTGHKAKILRQGTITREEISLAVPEIVF
ncbi:L-threonylcarbamoyladenylate synthase [Streptococcus porcorum]|uniref:L-threonylcarbamoyladenylate synthase n=1 Tax=Streptococcus porcorum TaxID=701526 RepID=A0ABV2JDT9_9STRE